jgi:hypothetical protein
MVSICIGSVNSTRILAGRSGGPSGSSAGPGILRRSGGTGDSNSQRTHITTVPSGERASPQFRRAGRMAPPIGRPGARLAASLPNFLRVCRMCSLWNSGVGGMCVGRSKSGISGHHFKSAALALIAVVPFSLSAHRRARGAGLAPGNGDGEVGGSVAPIRRSAAWGD